MQRFCCWIPHILLGVCSLAWGAAPPFTPSKAALALARGDLSAALSLSAASPAERAYIRGRVALAEGDVAGARAALRRLPSVGRRAADLNWRLAHAERDPAAIKAAADRFCARGDLTGKACLERELYSERRARARAVLDGAMAVPLVREAPFPLVLGETEIGSIGVIVDSGASQSVVLAGLARELGIATTEGTIPVGVAAGTGQVQARMGILPVLNIGTLEIRNLPVLVVEAAALEQSGVGVILAPQRALSGFYVTLDFGLQEMRVSSDAEQPYDGRGINSIELPYVFVGFDIAIEAAVGKGGWALFGVDTGMSSSYVVNTAYNNSATVRQAQIAGLGVHEQGVGVLEAVPVSIGNMAILPDEHGWQSPGMLTPDCVQLSGLLGNGLWRDGVVTFDTRAQKLRLLLPKR